MKKFILIYSAIFLLSIVPAPAAQFFETLYDVPVMDGLTEVPEMALSFDKPNGRIAEAAATSLSLSEDAIINFYKTSLFQMGWQFKEQALNHYIYHRESEELIIYVEKSDSSLLIRFLLQPQE